MHPSPSLSNYWEVQNKDPTAWLYGAKLTKNCIPTSYLGNVLITKFVKLKDPSVWLYGAKPAKNCILTSYLENAPTHYWVCQIISGFNIRILLFVYMELNLPRTIFQPPFWTMHPLPSLSNFLEVQNKDPAVWLYGARPANKCIQPHFVWNAPTPSLSNHDFAELIFRQGQDQLIHCMGFQLHLAKQKDPYWEHPGWQSWPE